MLHCDAQRLTSFIVNVIPLPSILKATPTAELEPITEEHIQSDEVLHHYVMLTYHSMNHRTKMHACIHNRTYTVHTHTFTVCYSSLMSHHATYHTQTHTHAHTHTCTCTLPHTHPLTHTRMHTLSHTYNTHSHMHMHMHTHTHTNTHTG